MKLVFIHPAEKIKKDIEGNIYTDGSYDMNIWNRYLQVADSIVLVMREDSTIYKVEEAQKRFNLINSNKISIISVPDRNHSIKEYFSWKLKRKTRAIIENQIDNADGVIVRLPGTEYVIDYAKKKRKPCLVEVVGCPFDSLWNHSIKGKILAIPTFFKLKSALKKSSASIYVTNKFLQDRYPTKGKQIGCSDVRIKEQVLEDAYFDSKYGQEKSTLVLGTAAATNIKYKGQQYVLMALAKLKKETNFNFLYQIAGNGDTSYLRSLVDKYDLSNSVQFMGSISRTDMNDWYKGLDIYVQPSLTEGLPRALIEAMSNGLPCIGSNAGGIPELLDKETIFTKKNVKELKKKILFMSSTTVRREKAKQCYQKSKEYNFATLDNKRIQFMQEVFIEILSNEP